MERRRRPRGEEETSDLPGPTVPLTPSRGRFSCETLLSRLLIVLLGIVFFFCVMYWLWQPSGEMHFQHEVEAQFGALADWVWEQVSTCAPLLPSNLPRLAVGRIRDPSFDEAFSRTTWAPLHGNPIKQADSLQQQGSVWVGGDARRGDISCSHQLLDFTLSGSLLLEESILSSAKPSEKARQLEGEEKKKSMLLGLLDYSGVYLNASCSLKRPLSPMRASLCGTPNHFCDRYFNDHVWFEIDFLKIYRPPTQSTPQFTNANQPPAEEETRQWLGTLRSMVAQNTEWESVSMGAVLPPGTRALDLKVCSQHRAGHSNDGMADDMKFHLSEVPLDIRGKSSGSCQITKLPMLRETGQGDGIIVVIWETDSYVRAQSLQWGWEPGRTFFTVPAQTTFVDGCRYVHKCEIPYTHKQFVDEMVPDHSASLFYRVACGGAESDLYQYHFPPPPFTYQSESVPSVRVAVTSDNQYGSNIMRHLVYDMHQFRPDLLLMAGDIVNRGYLVEEWGMYFWHPLEVESFAQRVPVVVARGNHDGEHALAFAYTAAPENRDWFAYTYGPIRFVVLDSNADTATSPQQLEWMKKEFTSRAFEEALFRVVMFHLPPYTELWSPKEGYNGEEFVREQWVPLFERYGVDIVINGHTHAYARGGQRGVMYTIVGGAGGMLDEDRVYDWKMFDVTVMENHYVIMETQGCQLHWTVYNTFKQVIDSITLPSRSVPNHIDCQAPLAPY